MSKLRSTLPRIFAFCCALVLLKWAIISLTSEWFPDYTVYWAAARLALVNPSLIYDDLAVTITQGWIIELRTGLRPWAYPPSALLPLLPFSGLPFKWSFAAFTGLTFAAFLIAAKSLLGERWKAGIALVAFSDAVLFGAFNGQMTFLIGALVIGGLLLLPKRPLMAGVLIGIAAALKPQLLVLAPLALIACRQYRALWGALAGGGAMGLLSLPLGISLWLDWLKSLPKFVETVESLDIWDRGVTPSAMLWNLGIEGPVQVAVSLLFAILAAIAVWNVFRSTVDPSTRLVALVGGGLWCSPYAMNYELAILMPAAAGFLLRGARGVGPMSLAIVSGMLLIVDGPWAPPAALAFILLVLKDHLAAGWIDLSRLRFALAARGPTMPEGAVPVQSIGEMTHDLGAIEP
jgi:hypothetical protein